MVLLSDAMLHRNAAREILLGVDTSRYVLAAKMLHKAAGVDVPPPRYIIRLLSVSQIFDHVASSALLSTISADSPSLKIAEATPDFHSAMRDLCLLEAQEVAIHKAVTDRTCSLGVLAKLCMDVVGKASFCQRIVARFSAQPSELRFRILEMYLILVGHVYRNLACCYMASIKLEGGHHGQAVAYLNVRGQCFFRLYISCVYHNALTHFRSVSRTERNERHARIDIAENI